MARTIPAFICLSIALFSSDPLTITAVLWPDPSLPGVTLLCQAPRSSMICPRSYGRSSRPPLVGFMGRFLCACCLPYHVSGSGSLQRLGELGGLTAFVCFIGEEFGGWPWKRPMTAVTVDVIGGTKKLSIRQVCASSLISFISGLEVI